MPRKMKPEDDPSFGQRRRTPPWLFKKLEKLVGRKFKLDAAADQLNALCRKYYTAETDGLVQPWRDATFCNPGFQQFKWWIEKAVLEGEQNEITSCLIGPKGCSQSWYHTWARRGTIYAPDQRLVFNHPDTGEPTHGAREDTMVFLVGPGFWNKGFKKGLFDVRQLSVKGEVIKA